MTKNQTKLRMLMASNDEISTMKGLAEFWGLSYHTVHAYLKPESSKSHRPIPDEKLSGLYKKLNVSEA